MKKTSTLEKENKISTSDIISTISLFVLAVSVYIGYLTLGLYRGEINRLSLDNVSFDCLYDMNSFNFSTGELIKFNLTAKCLVTNNSSSNISVKKINSFEDEGGKKYFDTRLSQKRNDTIIDQETPFIISQGGQKKIDIVISGYLPHSDLCRPDKKDSRLGFLGKCYRIGDFTYVSEKEMTFKYGVYIVLGNDKTLYSQPEFGPDHGFSAYNAR